MPEEGRISIPPRTSRQADDPTKRARIRREEREREALEGRERQATVTLWSMRLAGGLFLALGFFYLFVQPSNVGTPEITNLHRLFTGMMFAIVGAIFFASGWRPR